MVQKRVTSVKLAFDLVPSPFDASWAAIILCGIPIILEAVIGLVTAFDIKADVLVSLALIASVCIGEDFAAGEVAFIMQLGGLLEELTVARARAGIEKLVHLTPQTARVITGRKETAVPAEDVKVGEDSSIQRMIRLVQSADAGKAKIVGLADRWAAWIVVIALTAAALTWMISGEIIRAVTILVVFCPCALVLATPTAIMAAIGNATKHGFLVREGNALERLAAVNKITFDKTGTLTYGTPRVVLVHSALPFLSDHELYRLCAAAERYSEHPLGKAITRCSQQKAGEMPIEAEDFQMVPGHGVGSDIAVDAAGIVLVDDKVKELPHLIALSKRMMRTIKLNITFSLTLNFIAIVLAITGTLNPVVGALVHNAGSVLVITNSALLLKWRQTASQSFASADAKSV